MGPVALAIALLVAIPAFWMGLESLGAAWVTPEYSHGPLIPVISFYLFLRQLKQVAPLPASDRWPGVAIVAVALAVASLGSLARIPDIVTYAMILWVFGVVLTIFGLRRGFQFWPPVLHLVFMLPLPNVIYWKLSIQLQFISSEIGVWVIRLLDIPVYLEGNIIDLGVYKLHVAEACSGLRYLFPVMSFSYIFAVLYRGPVWQKAVMLISAAPITVLMNSFRVGMIGVLVDSYGIEQAEGFLHAFEGWVIFVSCIGLLFLMAILMKRLVGDRRPLGETLDLDYDGIGAQFRRVFDVRAGAAMLVIVALTAAVASWQHLTPQRAAVTVERTPLSLFPPDVGGWRGSFQMLDPSIERVLGADDYLAASYSNPMQGAPVDFFVAYYDKMTEGSGVHSPEVCLPAGGWEMSAITQANVSVETGEGPISLPVNRAIIQKGTARQLVWYWFDQRGRRMTNDYVAKAYSILDALTIGRTDGGLVRLITSIRPGETEEAAEARLQSFLEESLPRLPSYIPG
jgi:exosortase D (VPLPA-CTERM-specific)